MDKLLRAGFIRRVIYPEWLANVVLVKKSSGKWRMCVDFTDLNKACPKDSYPLPNIDQMVDATSGYKMFSFIDASSGYHQIPMHKEDQEKTSFVTDFGTFCYTVMPFGLKNTGATYQRLVDKMFGDLRGTTVEAYVDDMVIKSKTPEEHPGDLAKVFSIFNKYKMKLNPEKCIFAVKEGKFLGHMVSGRGIEANPEKIKAIQEMQPPKTLKEIQKLNGRINAIGRFLSCSARRCLPFYKTLKGQKQFT